MDNTVGNLFGGSQTQAGTASPVEPAVNWRAWHDFARHALDRPHAPAIRVNGQSLTYGQFNDIVLGLARSIQSRETDQTADVTAVYADRSIHSYAGVLAASMLGHAYVPLNPKFPADRNQVILEKSGAAFAICSPDALPTVRGIVSAAPVSVVSDDTQGGALSRRHDNSRAYILFTSGSTGTPKGVPITHDNLNAYLTAAGSVTDFGPQDRFSQNFDLTFDLSVHDMFLCWRAGGELVVPSETDLERPAEYARRESITCWFSVPSLAQKMNLQGALEPGNLAGIRHSLFCGEALPMDLAIKWQAATESGVENWYGPTEATIACMRYVLPQANEPLNTHLGLTPLGTCLPGMDAIVLNADLQETAPGDVGELYLSGPQLTSGYLDDPERTAQAFGPVPGKPGTWYRTGDRVKRADPGGLQFVDRADNQIKIRGYRVEIGEIEAKIRDLSGGCTTVVTPLPLKSPNPTALVASVEGWSGNPVQLLSQLKTALPAYMVPTAIRSVGEFPKNASGKVDRGKIGESVSETPESGEGPKTGLRKQLILMARRINPAMTREQILASTDLMEAGLDSIAFTEFTMEIEKTFGIELDQNKVAAMAEMKLPRLVRFLKRQMDPDFQPRKKSPGAGRKNNPEVKKRKKSVHYKSRRTVECVDKFPAFVEAAEHPLALFFGSSGVVSGLGTDIVQSHAGALGHPVTAANLGMAKLSNQGTVELIEYAGNVIRDKGKKVAFVLYELDVMQLSTLPTGREIEVVKSYLNGDYVMEELDVVDPWNKWNPDKGGTVLTSSTANARDDEQVANTSTWNLKREQEVVGAYMGRVNFKPVEAEIWLKGARMIQNMSPLALAFVHPIDNRSVNAAPRDNRGNRFTALTRKLARKTRVPLMRFDEFEMNPGDFRNYNHTNRGSGREALSRQLTEAVFSRGQV